MQALDEFDLSVEKGQVMGLLGPNGSGKTTTLGILLGAIKNYRGSYRWFDADNHHTQRFRIGAILEAPVFYPYLSGRDNLKVVARIKSVQKSELNPILQRVGLADRARSKFRTYSLGMKQRLAFAAALLGEPEVLVLDEPTNGLDPQGIADIRRLIGELAERGTTIILASHLLDEVEKVCTHVAVLKKGNLLRSGAVADVVSDQVHIHLSSREPNKLLTAVSKICGSEAVHLQADTVIAKVDPDFDDEALNRNLIEQGIVLTSMRREKKRLEDEFLELTQ